MKNEKLPLTLLYGLILLSVLFVGISTTIFSRPEVAHAAGGIANVVCTPLKPECSCGFFKNPKTGACDVPGNKFKCPCSDDTSGFTTSGVCMVQGQCKAESSGGMPPMLPMLPMPMPMPDQNQDPCSSGSGSGGIVSDRTGTSTNAASSTCPNNSTPDFSQSFPNYDTSSFNNTTTGSDSNPAPDMISSLLNGNESANTTGNSTQASGSVVPGATTAAPTKVAPFGSVDGVTGDVQVQGVFVRVLASNRNTARGTQVSGFYGFQTAAGVPVTTIFQSLCGLRPWSANFMSFIVPSSYFDALCTARNFAVGVTTVKTAGGTSGSSGSGSTSSGKPKIGPTSAASGAEIGTGTGGDAPKVDTTPPRPTNYLGKARVDIWATPSAVSAGQRTSIFWDTTGVYTCSISSSDRSFTGSSLSGHASTQPLKQNTTFMITCQTATSTMSNQVIVPVK